MGPTWVLSAPGGPHAGPMNFAIRVERQSWYWNGSLDFEDRVPITSGPLTMGAHWGVTPWQWSIGRNCGLGVFDLWNGPSKKPCIILSYPCLSQGLREGHLRIIWGYCALFQFQVDCIAVVSELFGHLDALVVGSKGDQEHDLQTQDIQDSGI